MNAQVVPGDVLEKKEILIIESEPSEAAELRSWRVLPEQDDMRLDRLLTTVAPEFSRSYLQQLIEQMAVTCNGVVVTKSAKHVRQDDVVVVALRPTEQSQAYVPEPLPLDVVFEDEHLLVVNKPAGLVVHPAPGNWRGTLLNAVLYRYPQSRHLPRAGIVHRLDKDTSGLMVIAKTRLCMDALTALISKREVTREYLAIAHGAWRSFADRHAADAQDDLAQAQERWGMNGELVFWEMDAARAPDRIAAQSIGRDVRNRLKMAAYDAGSVHAKPARTDIYVVKQTDNFTVVRCKLHTGRTHQIRVHMAYLGHPLVADGTYGGQLALGLERQALHAWRLAFRHPMTEAFVEWVSPLPQDIQVALKQCEAQK